MYDQFLEFFTSRQLPKGMQVVMYWTAKGELDLATVAPGAQVREVPAHCCEALPLRHP